MTTHDSALEEIRKGISELQEALAAEASYAGDPTPGVLRHGTNSYIPCPVCKADVDTERDVYCPGDQEETECPKCGAQLIVEVAAVPILLAAYIHDQEEICGTCGHYKKEEWPGATDPCKCTP